jgi:tetratricopeptide (TPR) repeat protein
MRNIRSNFPARALLRPWLLLFLGAGLLLLPGTLRAAQSAEDKAFSSAREEFDDHQYNLAETSLSHFLTVYTNSAYRAYAILYLARSRLEQSNYDGAIQKLTSAVSQSGDLAGEYVFWIASALLDKGAYAQAAEEFANFIKNFPEADASRRLEAACDEAEAFSKMKNWPRVVELLQKPDSAFRKLAAENPKSRFVTRGLLLLGEALSAQGKYADGEKVVGGIDPAGLEPEWQWRRQYLLCRLELDGGRAGEALQNSSNLLDTASGPRHQAASRFLRGEILEALGRADEALQSYTNNLAGDLAPADQRLALLKIVQLTLAQNQIQDAVQLLENYVVQRTNGAALDLARLSLGELCLKIYYSPAPAATTADPAATGTNFLLAALADFDSVITNFPASPLVAQARLDRGWCYWAETNMTGAQADFQAAADLLRPSPEQAVARFKLADVEFYEHNYGGAVTNYSRLLQEYATVESVTNGLFDQALYQIVQADLARGDQAGAQAALRKILDWYPNSLFGDRGQLLIGKNRRYDYAMARRVFNDLLKRSPQTPLRPEVQYAIARTYEQEGNWPEALRQYESWVNRHATNAPLLLPRVEYSLALVYGKAGMETNALALFTNFVARFPSNSLAPWARNWVADYYFNLGDNQSAEANYELLYQKFPNAGDLPYQALLMAGRAALARQGTIDARGHFADLVANPDARLHFPDLVAQGWFALGDTILQQFQDNPTNGTFFNEAIQAISNLTNGAPTNAMAALAYGRLGDYYMQWGDMQWDMHHDPNVYTNAAQMYQTVLNFPATNVDAATRSEAEVALGRVAEQQGQTGQAVAHYCKVLYELDPDHFDPFWVEQAGKAAGRLYERQQQWDKAIKVYQRVKKAVPSLRPALEKAIIAAQSDADKARN